MPEITPRPAARSPWRQTVMLVLAAVGASVSVGAAPAAADSIVYVKDGDVWRAAPDGARTQQLTRTGGYGYVSQADDGSMVALAPGERLHRLSPTGAVLADFTTMVSDGLPEGGPLARFHGPFTPEISPDGTKVAYEWVNDSYEGAPGCSDTSVPPCFVFSQRQGVAVSHADRHTGPEAFGLLTGWIFPHWMSDDVMLRSFSGTILTDDAVFTTVGPAKGDRELDPWFFDASGYGVDDVELSRDLRTVVGVGGQHDEELRVYRTAVHPYGAPDWNHRPFATGNQPVAELCAVIAAPAGQRFESPSLAPDGRGLAYGLGDGIHVLTLPDPSVGCDGVAQGGPLLIPGARHADWGPADLAAAPTGEGSPAAGGPAPVVGSRAALSVRSRRSTTAMARRSGVLVTARTGSAGRLVAKALLGRRVVGTARATVGARGVARLRIRLTRGALGSRRRATLVLHVTFAPADRGPVRRLRTRVVLRG